MINTIHSGGIYIISKFSEITGIAVNFFLLRWIFSRPNIEIKKLTAEILWVKARSIASSIYTKTKRYMYIFWVIILSSYQQLINIIYHLLKIYNITNIPITWILIHYDIIKALYVTSQNDKNYYRTIDIDIHLYLWNNNAIVN